jgi:hypothetical protein
VLAAASLGACVSTTAPTHMEPNWRGPAVHCRHLGDRGLELELQAPTAGHAFELVAVRADGERATVDCVHRLPPPDVLVAQVMTPLRVQIGPGRLGAATVVAVRVLPPGGAAQSQLALVTARP